MYNLDFSTTGSEFTTAIADFINEEVGELYEENLEEIGKIYDNYSNRNFFVFLI